MTYVKKKPEIAFKGKKAKFGVSSMTSTLETVGMLKPMEALRAANPAKWHYGQSFDPTKIDSNYQSFTNILADLDVEVLWMEPKNNMIADSVFTYDASFMTRNGAILLSPGKPLRKGEEKIQVFVSPNRSDLGFRRSRLFRGWSASV